MLILPCGRAAFGDESESSLNEVLSVTESLFKAMKDRDYPGIWNALSARSRDTIVDEIYKAIAKTGGKEIPKDDIRKDFTTGGPLAKGYWNGFLRSFDPVMVLEQSTWNRGNIGKERAEIFITYRRSENPAQVRLFKENGAWKVGLTETFWGSR